MIDSEYFPGKQKTYVVLDGTRCKQAVMQVTVEAMVKS